MTAGSHPCDCSAASGQVGDPGRGPGSRRCENGALLSPVLAQLPRDLLRGVSLDLHEETKWPAPLRSAAFRVPHLLCVPSLLCLRGTEHPWAMAGPRGHLHGGRCRPFPTKLQMLPGQLSNSQTRNAKRPPVESWREGSASCLGPEARLPASAFQSRQGKVASRSPERKRAAPSPPPPGQGWEYTVVWWKRIRPACVTIVGSDLRDLLQISAQLLRSDVVWAIHFLAQFPDFKITHMGNGRGKQPRAARGATPFPPCMPVPCCIQVQACGRS